MHDRSRRELLSGVKVTSFGTLASRVLGMLRDMATASLLGLSGGVMDALVVAFRIPNLFRGLFGEGALAASYLPVLSGRLEQDRQTAWQLVTATLVCLSLALACLVFLGEAILGLLWLFWRDQSSVALVLELSAVLLPYLFLICLAAQVATTLQACSRFALPAVAPAILNVVWLAAAWWVAPAISTEPRVQVQVLAGGVLLAGGLQLAVQLPQLWRLGFRPELNWRASRDGVRQIVAGLLPTMLGLAITRINVLLDSLMAWGLSAAPGGSRSIGWLGGLAQYPLEGGAAASIYFAERLYHFPVGLLGIAVATVIFPLLSRHAARGDRARLGADLTHGLRLVLLLGLPASGGLILLAEPLSRLLFERGQFTAADSLRTARVIAGYSCGVWAYCALPVLLRGYYALGDRLTPLRVGLAVVGLNLALNLLLIWPLAEVGLAVSTALCAALQAGVLVAIFARRFGPLQWTALGGTTLRTIVATAAMLLTGHLALEFLPSSEGLVSELARVCVPLAVCLGTFGLISWLLGDRDIYSPSADRSTHPALS